MIKTRPPFDLWFMRLAFVVAQRGSCTRKQVGAVLVDGDHRIVATGYNGAPKGMPDCLAVGCDEREIDGKKSCVRTLHAESNAIDYAGKAAEGCVLYTTVIPCRPCAQRIIQAGIHRVIYFEHYLSQGTQDVEAMFADKQMGFPRVVLEQWKATSLASVCGSFPLDQP